MLLLCWGKKWEAAEGNLLLEVNIANVLVFNRAVSIAILGKKKKKVRMVIYLVEKVTAQFG